MGRLDELINQGMNGGPQPPPMQIAMPLNDVQLVSVIAAIRFKTAASGAVKEAMDIVAEAVVQMEGGKGLVKLIEAKQVLRQ